MIKQLISRLLKGFAPLDYTVRYRCVACKEFLGFSSVMRSHGCCPYCGNLSASTIVAVEEVVGRWEPQKYFWQPLIWTAKEPHEKES